MTLDRKPTLSSTTDGDMVCRIVRSEAKSAPWLLIGLSGSAGPFGGGGKVMFASNPVLGSRAFASIWHQGSAP